MTSPCTSKMMLQGRTAVFSVLALLALPHGRIVTAFQPSCVGFQRTFQLRSSIGDDPPRPPPGDDGDDDRLEDFLRPKKESENLKKAREYISERSLPISFDVEPDIPDETAADEVEEVEAIAEEEEEEEEIDLDSLEMDSEESSAITFGPSTSSSLLGPDGNISKDTLAKNPYMQVVSKLSPSELIARFTATANPRVQEAVRSTILGLIGNLPKMAFDTKTITTGQRLASLMFQLQMTGYMFKNAEYRLSMSQSLGMTNGYSSNLLLTGSEDAVSDEDDEDPLLSGKVKGKLKIRYGNAEQTEGNESESPGMEIEVDAAAYMSELRSEVSKLKEELAETKEANEEALRKDLLLFIRTLPAQELKSLTNTMSPDVTVCMKGLVQAVLSGIGDGMIGPETVTEQSGEAMAQLCMWQLAVGYNLRELEVREEMKKSLQSILGDEGFDRPGTME